MVTGTALAPQIKETLGQLFICVRPCIEEPKIFVTFKINYSRFCDNLSIREILLLIILVVSVYSITNRFPFTIFDYFFARETENYIIS